MPLLTPLAVSWPSEDSKTARHMEHWASASWMVKNVRSIKVTAAMNFFLLRKYMLETLNAPFRIFLTGKSTFPRKGKEFMLGYFL